MNTTDTKRRRLLRPWITAAPGLVATILEMVRLAWRVHPLIFTGLVVLTVANGLLPVALIWVTKLLFDLLGHALQGNRIDLAGDMGPILVLQAALFMVSRMFDPLYQYLNAELGRRVGVQVQEAVYRKLGSFTDIAYFENPEFHDVLQLATQGAQSGPSQTLNTLTQLVRNCITLLSFVGILVVVSPFLAILIGLAALPRLFTELKIGRQRFQLAMQLSPSERRVFYYTCVLSSVDAAKELRLFGLSNYFIDEMLNTYQKIQGAKARQQLRELRLTFVQELVAVIGYGLVFALFAAVVVQTATGRLSLGDIPLYIGAIGSMQGALGGIVRGIASLNEHALFFSRYQDLMALPQRLSIPAQVRPVPPLTACVEFNNVSFRYTAQHPWILRNANLRIPAGKCVALVGANGAGKTTLVKLLARLYDPTEGAILWNGIDIREFDPEALRRGMGVVLQDFMRYALTARENIGLGDVGHLDRTDCVYQAAVKAGVHDMIEKLPHAYQTTLSRWLVDDGTGIDLSTGQWQRIALARVFMRDASLIVLDEPTASLDAEAEHDVYSRFVKLIGGRTSLLISHRFSTVKVADVIAVLENGQITEYGTHAELLSLDKTYAKLYNIQAAQYT